ncbi:MAG: polynucleotide adenylyltransferase [Defluviitaleaceae bacterium]|nr:polynucleotide adenylyltransferase [Defluviitaleaceae bacterium]
MTISIPTDVNAILDSLMSKGHEAYIVGGCVRDSIRGVVPKDWDITTSALPSQVVEIFPRTYETGIKHGTITVLVGSHGYEVTTYRIDGTYQDSRRPQDVTFTSNIQDDLSRRDFTMNAIAYNPVCGFVDPYDGQVDIGRKLIRCVGDAHCRFGEDALRMLRAVRFAGQLGFAVDDAALEAIFVLRSSLAKISAERIRDELVRLITSPYVEAINLLESTGLLPYVLFGHTFDGDIQETSRMLADCPMQASLRLTIFIASSGIACNKIMRELRFDNKIIRDVSLYVNMLHSTIHNSRYEIKKNLRQMPQIHDNECPRHVSQKYFENLLILKSIVYPQDAKRLISILHESRDIQASGECYTLRDLLINGEILAKAGIPRGKAIGDKLEKILDIVMRDPKQNLYMYDYYVKNMYNTEIVTHPGAETNANDVQ